MMVGAHLFAVVVGALLFLGSSRTASFALSFAFAPSLQRRRRRSSSSRRVSTSHQLHAGRGNGGGLYRPFCEHALSRLVQSGLFVPSTDIPTHLQQNEAPAKGMPPGTLVKIETRALLPKNNNNVMAYARCALLETIPFPNDEDDDDDDDDDDSVSTRGIQVMNLVVFPSPHTNLPVWGVDLVSLPGDKHLLAMDVQPMTTTTTTTTTRDDDDDDGGETQDNPNLALLFQEWHEKYFKQHASLEWGGDMPEQAQKFFSPNVLWTRLKGEGALPIIQGHIMDAFVAHLELYLQLVEQYSTTTTTDNTTTDNTTTTTTTPKNVNNYQEEYLQYRLMNDPARPMLQSLYGVDWTEQLLTQVLFPKLLE
jgi:phycoerythrobilin:ferredoxin oxidoreductase